MIAGLYSFVIKVEILGTSCIMCAHAFGGILLFHREGTDAYFQWQDNDHYVLHSAAVTVTSSNGCSAKGAPRVCSPDKESDPAVCKLTGEPILACMDCV